MEIDPLSLVFADLIAPGLLLLGAMAYVRRFLPARRSEAVFPMVLAGTYPIWMLVWTFGAMAGGGMIGPCGTSDMRATTFAFLLGGPSVVWAGAFRRVIGSNWMMLAPFAGDAVVVAVNSVASRFGSGGGAMWNGWAAPWSPYIWLAVVVGLGAWCVAKKQGWPEGACQSCGYDLVGLGDAAKCPECGACAVVGLPGRDAKADALEA